MLDVLSMQRFAHVFDGSNSYLPCVCVLFTSSDVHAICNHVPISQMLTTCGRRGGKIKGLHVESAEDTSYLKCFARGLGVEGDQSSILDTKYVPLNGCAELYVLSLLERRKLCRKGRFRHIFSSKNQICSDQKNLISLQMV